MQPLDSSPLAHGGGNLENAEFSKRADTPLRVKYGSTLDISVPHDTIRELCRLRTTLEAFAIVRVRALANSEHLFDALAERLRVLKTTSLLGHRKPFHKADMAFHRFMVKSAEVPVLLTCWEQVAGAVNDWIQQVKDTHWPSLMALYREHETLLEKWRYGDVVQAEQATHHHIETGWYRVEVDAEMLPIEGDAVDRAASFFSTHYADPVNVRWVAKQVSFVSSSQLTRLFRKQFGVPPYMWLRRLRMERAAELLLSGGLSIGEIAHRVGYRNASHFVRDFRMHFGCSPGKYRREQFTP